jgi:competence protein ComEC
MQQSRVAVIAIGFFVAGVAIRFAVASSLAVFAFCTVALGMLVGYAFFDRRAMITAIWLFLFLFGVLRADAGPISFSYAKRFTVPLELTRDLFAENLMRALPEPAGSYIAGVLLGARSAIPYDVKEAFRRTGTSHILALSGYNVTILARALESIFNSFWISFAAIILFVGATGAASSLVRAAIMGVIVLVAKKYRRAYSAPHALALAVFAMLVADPALLFGDIGFQLSVAATLGLIYFEEPIAWRIRFVPATLGFRDALASTLAAEAATLPLVLFYFGFFSPAAPIVNMLVLPTIPAVMLSGFLVGISGFVSNILAGIFAWPAYLLAAYQLGIIQFFAHITFF